MRIAPTSVVRHAPAALAVAAAIFAAGCGDMARTGRAPVIVVVESIEAASGANPTRFTTNLLSDVQTLVTTTVNGQSVRTPTIFNDLGRVSFRTTLKNPGSPTTPLSPTELNEVTMTRYRVAFRRSDGRNTPGVDVPHTFDGAFTVTIPATGSATQGFDLVRHQAKLESPLRNLIAGGGAIFISTVAEITFWGHDQAGNEVQAMASISVQFGDFADP